MSDEETFKSVDDILEHYGWGGPIKLVEVKNDVDGELPGEVPGTDEVCEGERDITNDETDICVPSDR